MAALRARRSPRRPGNTGAVYAEFVVAAMPFFFFFMCLWQLGMMITAKLMVVHAAESAARSAAVVIAEPGKWSGDPAFDPTNNWDDSQNVFTPFHMQIVNVASEIALAPLMEDGSITDVDTQLEGNAYMGNTWPQAMGAPAAFTMLPMHVKAKYHCRLPLASRFVCGTDGTRTLESIGIYPYQGSLYQQVLFPVP